MSASARQSSEEAERKRLICECSPAGDWVVNKAKLAKVVKSEGLQFVDTTAGFRWMTRPSENQVFLMTNALVCEKEPHKQKEWLKAFCLGWLYRNKGAGTLKLAITQCLTQATVVKWIRGDGEHCIVCYESFAAPGFERAGFPCQCGAVLCFGCLIDLISIADKPMTCQCPYCRREGNPFHFFVLFLTRVSDFLKRELPLGEISEEHLDFIEKVTSVDLTLPRKRAMVQMTAALRGNADIMRRHGIVASVGLTPELGAALYKDIQKCIDSIRKKKVASASADVAVTHSSYGCANCGKRFWDKSERKRAPKCLKCRRTAYCNAKCRKKHTKKHAAECSAAKGAKKKRKAKKKPKKGGCAPY